MNKVTLYAGDGHVVKVIESDDAYIGSHMSVIKFADGSSMLTNLATVIESEAPDPGPLGGVPGDTRGPQEASLVLLSNGGSAIRSWSGLTRITYEGAACGFYHEGKKVWVSGPLVVTWNKKK